MNTIEYRPIGIIRTPFEKAEGTPIQPTARGSAEAVVEVFPEYTDGLADLDGFSHIILLYHLHKSRQHSLRVKPFLDDKTHGLFATRAPSRPNAIGLSVVCLAKVEGSKLYIKEADMLVAPRFWTSNPMCRSLMCVKSKRRGGWRMLRENLKKHGMTADFPAEV